MNIKAIIFSGIAIAGTAMLLASGYTRASSDDHDREDHALSEHDEVRRIKQRGDILSLEEILQYAGRHHTGRVLETGLEHGNGRYLYEIELVDESGEVWEMNLDAQTGELLKEERED